MLKTSLEPSANRDRGISQKVGIQGVLLENNHFNLDKLQVQIFRSIVCLEIFHNGSARKVEWSIKMSIQKDE